MFAYTSVMYILVCMFFVKTYCIFEQGMVK